jgi:LPPG:FO 2-phospho-L-lactate transferase
MIARDVKVVALCGGVGGAKLAFGLSRLLGANLTIVVNTGDDFEHLGLKVSPDLDTVTYTLAGLSDDQRGWGRAGESWSFMESLDGLGGDNWFRLGDRDLALHVLRTEALRKGQTLTEFTCSLAVRLGIDATLLPMSDDWFSTFVVTEDEKLPFQRYFVELQARPVVQKIEFEGDPQASATEDVLRALSAADAIVICPSNPYLSIDPILRLPGILRAIESACVPKIAVSPLVGGRAIKGPTAKIMQELGVPTRSSSIVSHYRFLDGIILDRSDAAETDEIEIAVRLANTVMNSSDERVNLALECLNFFSQIKNEPQQCPTWTPGS